MTNQAPGSSLLQARGKHNQLHDHNRLHARNQQNNHPHARDNQPKHPHIRSPEDATKGNNNLNNLQPRRVVVVQQTISVVQIIDATGAVVGVQTLAHPVTPQSLKSPAGVTTVDSDTLGFKASPSVPVVAPTIGDGVAPSSTASASTGVKPGPNESSLSSNSGSLTSAPSSSFTSFPTLSGTGGFFSSNSTRGPSLFSNNTVHPHSRFVNTTSKHATVLATTSKSSSSTKSRSSTTLWTSASDVPTIISIAGPGDPGLAGMTPVPLPTSVDSNPPRPGLTPETQSAVAGGVVGGVAGIALIVLFAMFLLKWRKRNGGAIQLLGDGESLARGGLGPASGPSGLGGDGNGGGGMTERRSIPFAIPSSLASLTGQKRLTDGPAESRAGNHGNKGFYRVSGKKLISVLQSGGDGYSDPRSSVMSGSSYYRDSIFPDSLPPQRLQLGSPMRPESGVVIMRSGPGRTPVQEQTFSFDSPRPLPPPSVTVDPVGRSLISQDRSRGSGTGSARTRFTEEI